MRVAVPESAISGLLWLFDVERHTHRPLSRDGMAAFPVWSPDGHRIAFAWSASGPQSLWLVPVDGGGQWERLTQEPGYPSSFTPDGRGLLFVGQTRGNDDILLCRLEGPEVVPVLATAANERHPEVSPDGRWLAYVSDESGRDEVLVTSFPDCRRTLVVSREGGGSPVWSRDGKALYFLPAGDWAGQLLGVSVSGTEVLRLGAPTVIARLPPWTFAAIPVRAWDIHPDGQRFLFARYKSDPAAPAPVTQLHLVQNWFAELERLGPRGR